MGLGELLRSGRIVLPDGAMGTSPDERGWMGRGRVNLDAPDVVRDIHRAYVRCGCAAVIAHTLAMNRIYIETHGGPTILGNTAEECGRQLTDAGADAGAHPRRQRHDPGAGGPLAR